MTRLRRRIAERPSTKADDEPRLRQRRGHAFRVCMAGLAALVFVVAVGAIGLGLLVFRLSQGPISIETFRNRIERELDARAGEGYDFHFGDARIERGPHGAGLSFDGLTLKNAQGQTIVSAPRAEVSIHLPSLLIGRVTPTRLQVSDLEVRLAVQSDGTVSVSAGSDPLLVSKPIAPSAIEPADGQPKTASGRFSAMQPLIASLQSLFEGATSRDGVFGALKHVAISNGRLVFEDQQTGRATTFSDLDFSFDKSRARTSLTVSAQGPNGRWQVDANAGAAAPGERALEVAVRDVTFEEISLVSGLRDPGFDFDMPMTVGLRLALTEGGELAGSEGSFRFGKGYFYLKDPDHEPLLVDSLTGAFRWDVPTQRIILDQAEWRSAQTRITVSGLVTPPVKQGDPWTIEGGSAPGSSFGAERPGETPIVIDRGSMKLRVVPEEHKLVVDRLEALGPQLSVATTADFSWTESVGPHLRLATSLGRMPVRSVLRLWPSFIAAPVRGYLLDHLQGGAVSGHLSLDFDSRAFALLKQHAPPPDESVLMDFVVNNGTLAVLPGVPPLSGVEATGKVTGRTTGVSVSRGTMEGQGGRKLTLVEGSFMAPHNELKPAPATVSAHVTGSMDSLADILGREGMKPYGGMQIDTAMIKGQVDGQLGIDLKLGKDAKPDDTQLRVNASITNLSIDHLVGKEKLDQGALSVLVDRAGMKATGQGRLFGAPATIEMKKPTGGNTDATIGFQLDEAGRQRLGMNLGSGVSGPIAVKISAPFGVKDATAAQVELDFTRTGLDGVLPGLVKPAGKPAKAVFNFDNSPHGMMIDQLSFEAAGGAAARGSIELDANGNFRAAHLSQLRLSPGDDMKVDADQGRDGLKLNVRATAVDSRPFLKGVFTEDGSKDLTASKDVDLDLRSTLVTGSNRQALSNVDLKISRRGGSVRNFQLQGRSGKSSVIGVTTRGRDGEAVISVSTNEGGALLSFLDLYKRMEGGKLQLAARINGNGMDGSFRVNDFILRDEPALRRMVTEGVAARDEKGAIKIDTSAAAFTRLQATFARGNGQVVIQDGVMYGAQIGIKVDGSIDFNRDAVNISGTFVPAYGVNNLFSQIPLFGPILGGGSNEGLFAVNFRISGPASAPQLTINPLSAIAPGFLRKIFGAGTPFPEPPPAAPPPQLQPQR